MKTEAFSHHLEDGTEIVIRSLESKDADKAIVCLAKTLSSCSFLATELEEWNISSEQESAFLQGILDDGNKCMIGTFVREELVGMANFAPVSQRMKLSHRAECGISLIPDYQNKKIGRYMMDHLLTLAKLAGFEQMELQVDSLNHRAIHLYESLGFKKCGIFERGMKHKDGHYSDLDLMIAFL